MFTVFVSVLLAVGFVVFFVWQSRNEACDVDRDSLLPLSDGRRTAGGGEGGDDGRTGDRDGTGGGGS